MMKELQVGSITYHYHLVMGEPDLIYVEEDGIRYPDHLTWHYYPNFNEAWMEYQHKLEDDRADFVYQMKKESEL